MLITLATGVKSTLLASTKSVLVRHSQQIYTTSTDPMIMQANINLAGIDDAVMELSNKDAIVMSVILDNKGNVLATSTKNIGYKSQFFENEDKQTFPALGDEIYQPLFAIPIELPSAYVSAGTITDEEAKFVLTYMLPPCPGMSITYQTPITATLRYSAFNPKGESVVGEYPLSQSGYDVCNGLSAALPPTSLTAAMAKISVMNTELSTATPISRYIVKVDTAILSGTGIFTHGDGALPTAATRYSYQAPNLTNQPYASFDFDGDGTNDFAFLGKVTAPEEGAEDQTSVFTQDDTGDMQGIYLSSGGHHPNSTDPTKQSPDFVRLADKAPDFQHQGLLESISDEDFSDTDILVFRESNGMLITSRE